MGVQNWQTLVSRWISEQGSKRLRAATLSYLQNAHLVVYSLTHSATTIRDRALRRRYASEIKVRQTRAGIFGKSAKTGRGMPFCAAYQ
jgi:hypothetical protein